MTNRRGGLRPAMALVRHAPFRSYFAGRSVSLIGSSMAPAALALAILDASERLSDLGVVLAAQMIPNLILLLVGGAIADRRSRRTLLVLSNLGAAATQGAVAACLLSGAYNVAVIAALQLGNGAVTAFISPAQRGIVPELVAPHDLGRANALLATAQNATRVIGPTVAAILVVTFGGGWAILVDAVSYLGAAVLMANLPKSSTRVRVNSGLRQDLREGWTTFSSTRWIWSVTLGYCLMNVVIMGPWLILGPAMTRTLFGEAAWGVVLSLRAVGLLGMSVLMLHITLRRPLRIGQAIGSLGSAALIALSLNASLWVVGVAALVAGAAFTLQAVTWETSLQLHVRAGMLSRITSYDEMVSYLAIPIGQLATAPIAELWGTSQVALWSGIVYAVASVLPLLDRTTRSLRAEPVGSTAPTPS